MLNVKFSANIDIRDSVKYKAVMKEYQLGPNGAMIGEGTDLLQFVCGHGLRAMAKPRKGGAAAHTAWMRLVGIGYSTPGCKPP